MTAFAKRYSPGHKLLVGSGGISVSELLKNDLSQWT